MSAKITLTIRKGSDKEWAALKARLKPLTKDPRAKVGVVGAGASRKQGKLTMPELAAVHEFGSPKNRIPERSFIRSTLDSKQSEYAQLLRPLLGQLLDGLLNVKKLLGIWGAKAASDVKGRLLRGAPIPPPLSKTTLAERKKKALARQQKKGPNAKLRDSQGKFLSLKGVGLRPLIDEGQLVASLSWEVQMSGVEAVQS